MFAKHVLYLIWEFTESNFCTFVLPNTAFGVLGAFSGPSLTQGHVSSIAEILQRLPLVVLFNWSNVFIFDLANQRSPESIKEDLANKPWRPLPTGKVTAEQTRKGMLVVIPAVLFFNYCLGVWRESALILLLTWLYNDLRGGDEIIRDLIIAVAFGLYNGGSLSIAIGPESDITHQGYIWIGLVSGIVLTTMQVQDLKDQTGDRGRGRKTIPLVLGENVSRWMIGLFVPIWSCCCAFFWGLRGWGYALPMVLGLYITFRVVRKCAPEEDSRTWKLWCLWTAVVYFLPVSHRLQTTMEIPQVSVGQVFTLGLGAVGGLLTHYGVFIHGEWHTQAPNILIFHAFFFMSLFIERHVCKELGYEWLSDASISICTSYLASLVTSIVLYRLFFHRLTRASFPGPFYARVTKLWHVWQCRHSRNHLVLEDLRRQYGDFVRTGESTSVIDVFTISINLLYRPQRNHHLPS